MGLAWLAPGRPSYFTCSEKRRRSHSHCNVIPYSRVKQFLFQPLFTLCFWELKFIFLKFFMLPLMLRYNLLKNFQWSNFCITITNDSQSLSRHRNYLSIFKPFWLSACKMIWPKIIAGLWWDIISWEGSLPEIVMPFIKAELCLDTGVAVENIFAVFADAKLQTE